MISFLQNLFGRRAGDKLADLPMVDTKIELYKTDWCPHCKTAAMVLSKLNASNIHIYDIERQPARGQEMLQRSGRTSIPQVFIGDVHVGGASELVRAAQNGRLHRLLGLDTIDGEGSGD